MRLRSVPLSLGGVVVGVSLAISDYNVKWQVALFFILTAISLQILSNLSNELGDFLKGTDTQERQGMRYSLMDGGLSVAELKAMIIGAAVCCAVFGLCLVYFAFDTFWCMDAIIFLLMGVFAIMSAMRYTLGRHPYGYRGLGDMYVFLFFGLLTVLGGFFLCAGELPGWKMFLPAIGVGCFSVAVLNVNNIRDMKTDAATRVTVAMKMGPFWSRVYQTALIVMGWACMIAFCLLRYPDPWHYLFVVTAPLFIWHVVGVWKRKDKQLDAMLPLLVMSSFALCVLLGIGFNIFLL